MADRRHGGHHHQGHHHGHRRGGRRAASLFDYGDLRLLALAMIAEHPRHGYELMKAIEDRTSGSYSPSPGVIYPTLSWLEDMGYAAIDPAGGTRKRYLVTPEGQAFLAANATAAAALFDRLPAERRGPPTDAPAPILRAMETLKIALREHHRRGPIEEAKAQAIAAAVEAAARTVEDLQ